MSRSSFLPSSHCIITIMFLEAFSPGPNPPEARRIGPYAKSGIQWELRPVSRPPQARACPGLIVLALIRLWTPTCFREAISSPGSQAPIPSPSQCLLSKTPSRCLSSSPAPLKKISRASGLRKVLYHWTSPKSSRAIPRVRAGVGGILSDVHGASTIPSKR